MESLRGTIIRLVHRAGEAGIKTTDLVAEVGGKSQVLGKTEDGAVRVGVAAWNQTVEVWSRAGVVVRVKAA